MKTLREKAAALADVFPRERLEARAAAEIARAAASGAPVAVACSGGLDSLAALLLAWAHFPEARARLVALHFNHARRGSEADADARFVGEVCRALGVAFVGEKLAADAAARARSEGALRAARLDFFARAMRERGAKILVQGHQADDVAESLLMRVCRGAGTDGLAAPRPVSRLADGRVFARPLLAIPKSELARAARFLGLAWREDASNAAPDFFRNRVRGAALPALKAAAPFTNFARTRALAEEDADALDALAARSRLGETRLPAIERRLLRKIFLEEKISPGAKNFDALVAAVCAGAPLKFSAGARAVDWNGARLKIAAGKKEEDEKGKREFFFEKEIVEVTGALFEKIRAGAFPPTETVFLSGAPEVSARARLPGDRYRPLGAPGEKSVARLLTDKKIPRAERDALPVFADGTGIAWIPGLPPAERFRVRAAGTTALRLTYRKPSLT
ncbi:MAG: tRNA lysidine(34) synthetase TilS [Candidatus Spyradosoma sp.]